MSNSSAPDFAHKVVSPSIERPSWTAALEAVACRPEEAGILVVDHGSRVAASNELLVEFAKLFARAAPVEIVEPAHMELAEPSIATAYARCVARGARLVIVSPFFLLPGRHWNEDIPRLVSEAAAMHAGVRWFLAAPLGLHTLLPEIMLQRIEQCARHEREPQATCDVCDGAPRRCGVRPV